MKTDINAKKQEILESIFKSKDGASWNEISEMLNELISISRHQENDQPEPQSKNDVPYWVIEQRVFDLTHFYNVKTKTWSGNIHKATKFYSNDLATIELMNINNAGYVSEHIDISEPMKEGNTPEQLICQEYGMPKGCSIDGIRVIDTNKCIKLMQEYRNQAIVLPSRESYYEKLPSENAYKNIESLQVFDYCISEIKRLNNIK